jgi:peptidoglycan/xylan/chitin deacetylase (PgdA/CDA1 family)
MIRFSILGCVCAILGACGGTTDGAIGTHVEALNSLYEIDFSPRPSYLPNNVLVLTFDDAPDHVNTSAMLDVLAQQNVKTTFFVNTENWSSVNNEPAMQAVIRRIVSDGHTLANHTVHHPHLPTLGAAAVESEISGVEQTMNNVFGGNPPSLTLFRAPYGEPFQGNNPANPSAAYQMIAPIVARHAVQIGWAIDSFDYNCAEGDANCVFNNVTGAIRTPGQGSYGIILMHAVHSQTVQALPRILAYIRQNGFVLWSVEDVVRARFGRSSAQLLGASGGGISPSAFYNVINRNSGKCLDNSDWSTAWGTRLQQWGCGNQQSNQEWRFNPTDSGYYEVLSRFSGLALDVTGGPGATGTGVKVQLWGLWGGANQQWLTVSLGGNDYKLIARHSGKCLDVPGASIANGVQLQQWDCNGTGAQAFTLVQQP